MKSKILTILRRFILWRRYKKNLPKAVLIKDTNIRIKINSIEKSQFIQWSINRHGLTKLNEIEYEPNHTKLFRSLFPDFDYFLDVGAQIGYFSLLASTYNLKGIYAFEILPRYHRALNSIIKENELTNIETFNYAVGDGISDAEIIGFSDFKKQKTVSLDVFLKEKDIKIETALIKMDIEGYERFAIKGLSTSIANFKPAILLSIHKIFLEPHEHEEIISFMFSNYSHVFLIDNQTYDLKEPIQVTEEEISHLEIVDLLFTNKNYWNLS